MDGRGADFSRGDRDRDNRKRQRRQIRHRRERARDEPLLYVSQASHYFTVLRRLDNEPRGKAPIAWLSHPISSHAVRRQTRQGASRQHATYQGSWHGARRTSGRTSTRGRLALSQPPVSPTNEAAPQLQANLQMSGASRSGGRVAQQAAVANRRGPFPFQSCALAPGVIGWIRVVGRQTKCNFESRTWTRPVTGFERLTQLPLICTQPVRSLYAAWSPHLHNPPQSGRLVAFFPPQSLVEMCDFGTQTRQLAG